MTLQELIQLTGAEVNIKPTRSAIELNLKLAGEEISITGPTVDNVTFVGFQLLIKKLNSVRPIM